MRSRAATGLERPQEGLTDRSRTRESPKWLLASIAATSAGVILSFWSIEAGLAASIGGVLIYALVRAVSRPGIAWGLLVLSLGASGLSLTVGPLRILPEHVALAALVLCIRRGTSPRETFGRSARLVLSLLAVWLILLAAISLIIAVEPRQSLRLLLWIAINISAMVATYLHPLRTEALVRIGLQVTTIGASAALIVWVYGNMTGAVSIFLEKDYASDVLRLQGLMQEPNLYAGLLTLWAGVAYVFRGDISRHLLWTFLIVGGLANFATYTRVTWILFPVIAMALIVRSAKAALLAPLVLAMAGLLVALPMRLDAASSFGSVVEGATVRIGRMLDFSTGTGALRVLSTEQATTELTDERAWLTGFGFNAYPQRHDEGVTSYAANYLGNLWIALPYDGGLVGAVPFVLALVVFWMRTARRGSTLFVVSFAAIGTTTNPIWFAFPWVLAAIIFRGGNSMNSLGPPDANDEGGVPDARGAHHG